MSFTYDDDQLDTSSLYQVRLEIGDTDSSAPLLQDEEINRAIGQERNLWGAAARCCELVSRQLLRRADVRVGRGGTSLVYSSAANQYQQMAVSLRKRANGTVAPWSGGRVLADKADLADDNSLVQPIFTKTGGDSPWVGDETMSTIDEDQIENS